MVRISAIFHRLLHGAHCRFDRRGGVFPLRVSITDFVSVGLGVLSALCDL